MYASLFVLCLLGSAFETVKCSGLLDSFPEVDIPTLMAEMNAASGKIDHVNKRIGNLSRKADVVTIKPIAHVEGPNGRYSLSFADADALCKSLGTRLVSDAELTEAVREHNYGICRCGWTSDKYGRVPLQTVDPICGNFQAKSINYCGWQSTWDAFCKAL